MKLLIDIDDEMVCNDIKNKALEPTSTTDKVIINALYNGTPVSNEGDLISRSELKKVIDTVKQIGYDTENKPLFDYIELPDLIKVIDNAPTVSFMISPDYVTELQNLNKELIKQLEEAERPQGKWQKVGKYACECSICGESVCGDFMNFCPNCGADMRKEGAE